MIITAIRFAILIAIPLAVWLIILRLPIIRIAFERGEFDISASISTASVLGFRAVSVVFFAYSRVGQSFFYGTLQIKHSLFLAGLMTLSAMLLDVVLIGPLGINGLALGFSGAVAVTAIITLVLMQRQTGSLLTDNGLMQLHAKLGIAAIAMTVCMLGLSHLAVPLFPADSLVMQGLSFGITSIGGVSVFVVTGLLLRVRELTSSWRDVRSLITRLRSVRCAE
jgi:putative peptidoglycan lipid II flippase